MADTVDNDIAYAAVMNTVFQGGGLQQIQQTLQGVPDPVPALANMIFSLLSTAREASQSMNLNPKIWTSAGGVLDRVTKDICQLAASMGVQGADTPDFGVAVKAEIVNLMKAQDQAGDTEVQPSPGLLAQAVGPPQGQAPPQGGGMMNG